MDKPGSLRAHLTAATPDLQTNPDKLAVFVERGRLVCAGASSLSFEYAFTLKLTVLDYRGHADALMVPLLAWLRRHQVDILENPDRQANAIRFEAELLNQDTVDISIEVDLTERVIVKPGTEPGSSSTAQRYNISHLAEPMHVGDVIEPQFWEVTMGGQVLASWSFAPPQDGVDG